MLKEKIKLNYNDYVKLPDDKRYELIEGEIYMVPGPEFNHQIVSRNIGFLLWDYVKNKNLGIIVDAPLDVIFTPEDVVQPDIIFISNERKDIITKKNVRGVPDLLIEILSPSTMERDKIVKRILYARHGVREYWIVDTEAKKIEVMTLGDNGFELFGIFFIDDTLSSPLIEGFSLSLREVFE